ncbi:hypothetical protein Tco_0386782 [Tanacetum coccineum]
MIAIPLIHWEIRVPKFLNAELLHITPLVVFADFGNLSIIDSGRRNYGNQPRRPWQNPEHDGLLGSGSFPRPSGFASGTSAPKSQTNEPYHLNRSNEAYQPPRPYKAVPHVRPNTHDSFNDETFGSTESTSQDRAEEERKRRASFELMRKEQQKVLQEKQKSSANKQQSDEFTDMRWRG